MLARPSCSARPFHTPRPVTAHARPHVAAHHPRPVSAHINPAAAPQHSALHLARSKPVANPPRPHAPANTVPARFFATDADMLKFQKVKTTHSTRFDSRPDPRVKELVAVIENGDEKSAIAMVKTGKVDVNGHTHLPSDFWTDENTALTYFAKKGNVKAVKFLLTDLQAHPSASCACPGHQTALHYAAKNGHVAVVKVLLEHGASPNINDSSKKTPLDVCKTPEVREVIAGHRKEELKRLGVSRSP